MRSISSFVFGCLLHSFCGLNQVLWSSAIVSRSSSTHYKSRCYGFNDLYEGEIDLVLCCPRGCRAQHSLTIFDLFFFFCLSRSVIAAATMGFFDSWGDGASVVSRKSHRSHKSSSHKHKRDKSRSRSQSREHRSKRHSSSGLGGLVGDDSNYSKHNASRGSFFNLGNSSTRSFFSMGESLSTSYAPLPSPIRSYEADCNCRKRDREKRSAQDRFQSRQLLYSTGR